MWQIFLGDWSSWLLWFSEAHVLTPKFCYCEGDYNKDLASFQRAGLKFPAGVIFEHLPPTHCICLVCKPLTAHGGDNAHKMIIFFKRDDLCHIELPAVLQNFENHNGFLLKAYVIGDFFHLVTRPSVKNLPLGRAFCCHITYFRPRSNCL